MSCLNSAFPIILYVVGIILLLAMMVVTIKLFDTLKRVDRTLDDFKQKSARIDEILDLADNIKGSLQIVNDRLLGAVVGAITNLFSKRKNKKEDEENE